jgi:Diguanylate cyclase, GGDEF domain/GAF domain
VPGTPIEPEALVVVPLVARGVLKGTLNVYREGEDASFTPEEFELARRLGDAAALALDNAHIRASLELQAQTDSLTGLYNHRYFHERLRRELTSASSAHETVGVVMVDIDDFKRVNDIYGHASATRSWPRSPIICARRCGRRTSSVGSAGRSSGSSCRRPRRTAHSRSPAGSSGGWMRSSSCSPGRSRSRSASPMVPSTP